MKPESTPQEVVRLLKVPMRIEVSRDDKRLLFSAPDHESNLHRIPVQGGGSPERVTQSRHFRETGPSFSPDGKRLAYEARNIGQQSEIWTANLDGSDEQRVSDPAQPGGMPVWSEDGKSIYAQGVLSGAYQRLDLVSRTVKQWNAEAAKRNHVSQMYLGRRAEVLQQELRDRDLYLSLVDLASEFRVRQIVSKRKGIGGNAVRPGFCSRWPFARSGRIPEAIDNRRRKGFTTRLEPGRQASLLRGHAQRSLEHLLDRCSDWGRETVDQVSVLARLRALSGVESEKRLDRLRVLGDAWEHI
jgi:hypothetical protein